MQQNAELTPRSSQSLGLLMALVTALSWSILAIALKFALRYAGAGTIAWFRFVVAAFALGLILALFKPQDFKNSFKLPWLSQLAGLGLAINFYGYMKGVEYTSPSTVQIFIQSSQIVFVFVGLFYFKERLRKIQRWGLVLALLGFSLFFLDQHQAQLSYEKSFLVGLGWIFLAALAWVGFATIQKILSKDWSPQSINLLIYLICALVLAPTAQISELLTWTPWIWLLMILLGMNTLLAYGALGYALKMAPANQVSLIIACNPILTLIFMESLAQARVSWIAEERVGSLGYLGAAVVVSGVGLAVQRSRKKSFKKM